MAVVSIHNISIRPLSAHITQVQDNEVDVYPRSGAEGGGQSGALAGRSPLKLKFTKNNTFSNIYNSFIMFN